MALKIIVSYDDTDNDRDALALGRLLAYSGAELSLAYVRHSQGGALEEKEAEELLARGAASVGAPDMPRHVVVNAGTSVGLAELAERENADVIVFGSEYRTAPGTVKPGIPAHKLLLGGPAAIAVAPAGPALAPLGERQHGRRDRRRRRGCRGDRRAASRRRSAPASSSTTAATSTCSWSARGRSRRLARSPSAPPATTRSRRRPSRCWWSRAAPRSASRRVSLRRPDHQDHGRDLGVAAVDPGPRVGPLDLGRASARGHLATAPSSESASTATSRQGQLVSAEAITAGSRPRPSAARSTSPAQRRGRARQGRTLEDRQLALARLPLLFAELEGLAGDPEARGSAASSASPTLKTRAWWRGELTSTWKGTGQPYAQGRWRCPCPTPSSSTTTASCSTRSRFGPGPSRTSSTGAASSSPGRQARAGRNLGRDRRRDPRAPPRRAGAGGRADRGAERAGGRRARARGGGDGRRPRAAAPAKQRGTPIGLVSNSPLVFVRRSLEIVGFEDRFDVVLSAHEVAAPKPAPDPYLEACRRLGVEAGPAVVALEDSPTGVAAARAAGLTVIGVPSLAGVELGEAHEIAESLLDAVVARQLAL